MNASSRFTRLDDWLEWQQQLHPSSIDLGLDRVRTVWLRLHPEPLAIPVITVAGTNAKGSTVAMLESILIAANYSPGCYTTPHLVHYNERIRLAGKPVSDEQICQAFAAIDQARDEISLTYFEFGTLAALYLALAYEVDVLLLEVGLGGRLDAVNIIDADVAVVTTVDLDHTDWLGSDREKIGYEKAGIFRPQRIAVCNDHQPTDSVLDYAQSIGSQLMLRGRDYRAEPEGDTWNWHGPEGELLTGLPLPALPGAVQVDNAAAVVMALRALSGRLDVSEEAIRGGLETVQLPGRFQRIGGAVEQVLDVAHNPQAARELAKSLHSNPVQGRTLAVFGVLADKALVAMVQALSGEIDCWYLASLPGERGRSSEEVAEVLREQGVEQIYSYSTVLDAHTDALRDATSGDRLVVFGSFVTVASVLQAPYNSPL